MGISTYTINKAEAFKLVKKHQMRVRSASTKHHFFDRSWQREVLSCEKVDGQNRIFFNLKNRQFVEMEGKPDAKSI